MEAKIIIDLKLKILLVVTIIMVFVGISKVFSQTNNVYRIQSLFLYNFTKHVKWEDTNGTFTVGIYGNSIVFAEIKKNFSNKKVWGKNVNVVEITSPAELANCHIAYLPKSNKKRILDFIDGADLAHTLLVTEDDMMSDGAAISFVFQQSKMNFKISREKIEQAGLKVSSSLISIGIPV